MPRYWQRLLPDGPRELEENDNDPYSQKPKVIRNPESSYTTGHAFFEPIENHATHEQLVKILDHRAGSQRGKPRSQNPLGLDSLG